MVFLYVIVLFLVFKFAFKDSCSGLVQAELRWASIRKLPSRARTSAPCTSPCFSCAQFTTGFLHYSQLDFRPIHNWISKRVFENKRQALVFNFPSTTFLDCETSNSGKWYI